MGGNISKVKLRGKKKRNNFHVSEGGLREAFDFEDTEPTYLNISDILPQEQNSLDNEHANQQNVQRSSTGLSRDSAFSDHTLNSLNSLSVQRLHSIGESVESDDNNTAGYILGDEKLSIRNKKINIQPKCCRTEYSTGEIPHMVEAFLPLLQDSIRVLEVIPYIDFIDDTRAFRNKERESPRDAVCMLIDKIKSSEESGKWKTFLDALSRGGYEYIHDLLKGRTEKDHTVQRRLLRLFTPRLINRIDPQEFIDHLYEKNVISEADMEEIKCEERSRGPIAASLMLLEYVPRKNHDWYDIFVDVLKKCGLEDMVDDFPSFKTTHKPALKSSLSESSAQIGHDADLGTSRQINLDTKDTESIKSYLTPVYEKSDADKEHCKPNSFGKASNKYEPLGIDEFTSNDILRLQHQRDQLKVTVDETKIKKSLMTEIVVLRKELLSLEYDKIHQEEANGTWNTLQDNENSLNEQTAKHVSTQTYGHSTLIEETPAMENRLKGIETNIELITKELFDIKRTSNALLDSEKFEPHPPINSSHNEYVHPIPHFKCMPKSAESGIGSDYDCYNRDLYSGSIHYV